MQALWKPSGSSLYFLYKPNQKTPLHLNVSRSKQKNISTLKCAFLIQIGLIIFLFLPFKLFISSWNLWSNSTHPDELSRVENSKACRHTKYGNWIQSKQGIKYNCWKSEVGYFIHCMTGRKVKFTWNDQNTYRFLKTLKYSLTGMWNFSCFSETRRNLISTKTKRNANARVWGLRFVRLQSTIKVFYFFRMLCRNYKILSMKKKTIILFMRKLRQIYSR